MDVAVVVRASLDCAVETDVDPMLFRTEDLVDDLIRHLPELRDARRGEVRSAVYAWKGARCSSR
jgi:hypothetical protein